ncbi:MAG: hypothetical protein VX642_00710, partial [Bdellovibrionota bacterium]|nr:hypothetical protein [Bdellovibrionota bacterium]
NKPQGWQGAAKAATGVAPLKKYISQKAGSFEEPNREVKTNPQIPPNKPHPKTKIQTQKTKNHAESKKKRPKKISS